MNVSEVAPKASVQAEQQSHPEVAGKKEKEKTMTDSNFERLAQLILNKIEKLDEKFDKINDRVGNLETEVAKGFAEVKGEIKRLEGEIKCLETEIKRIDEKIDGKDKRLENAEKISYTTLTALILAVVGGITKLLFFTN